LNKLFHQVTLTPSPILTSASHCTDSEQRSVPLMPYSSDEGRDMEMSQVLRDWQIAPRSCSHSSR